MPAGEYPQNPLKEPCIFVILKDPLPAAVLGVLGGQMEVAGHCCCRGASHKLISIDYVTGPGRRGRRADARPPQLEAGFEFLRHAAIGTQRGISQV